MQTVFNKAKVKSWIKKAQKSSLFGYGHGYITDSYVLLKEEPHMHPTILEVFGTLKPECRYTAEQFQRLVDLPYRPIKVIDSKLELVLEPKRRFRIFYNPKTGEKLFINCVYFDLFNDLETHKYYTNETMSMLWVIRDNEVVGVIAPYRLEEGLSHVSFKVEEEREQV